MCSYFSIILCSDLLWSFIRHQLNCKKNKAENNAIRKQSLYSPQLLAAGLSSLSNDEDLKDDASTKPLSKSLVGGSMNVCKLRVLNFMLPERVVQGLFKYLVNTLAALVTSYPCCLKFCFLMQGMLFL